MMNVCLRKIFVMIFILILPAVSTSGNENNTVKSSWQDYKIISTRNIFSRNRMSEDISVSPSTVQVRKQDIKEEGYLVLRGITKKADRFVAFIEDSRTGKMKQAMKGEEIGDGKIEDITIDFVEYKLKDKVVKIKTGMSMEGQVTGTASVAGSSGFVASQKQSLPDYSSDTKTGVQSSPAAEDSNAILQRLKERRKKELGE